MAGPGGGPPRKSHTKSRKGCKTCKRRHIRCDETFPQCRNCTKHNCRCDYMDMPAAGEEPLKGSRPPDLLMTPELQIILDNWRVTGDSPFPELQTLDRGYWTSFSSIDLRLVHHITALSIDLHKRGYALCTAWAAKMPALIAAAISSRFVMSALLAFSASHLAWETRNADTDNLACYHRGTALKGLHEAIGAFSRENSEHILAASMLLSWQATEWRSWASLQQGVSTVMNAMRPWAHESELAAHIDSQRSIARARTPVTPTYGASHVQPPSEDLLRLEQSVQALQDLRQRLANHPDLVSNVDQLSDYLRQLRRDFPLQAPEEAFERLQVLRAQLFWLPPSLFRPDESDAGGIAVLAHVYSTALALEPLFPEIGGSYLGTMVMVPLEKLHGILLSRRATHPHDGSTQVALSFLDVPMQILSAYRSRQRSLTQGMEAYRHPSHSPYTVPSSQMVSSPEISQTPVYSNSPTTSPGSLQVPVASYFQGATPRNIHRHSSSSYSSQQSRTPGRGSPMIAQHMTYPPVQVGHNYDIPTSMAYHEHASYPTTYGFDSRNILSSNVDDSREQDKDKEKGKEKERHPLGR